MQEWTTRCLKMLKLEPIANVVIVAQNYPPMMEAEVVGAITEQTDLPPMQVEAVLVALGNLASLELKEIGIFTIRKLFTLKLKHKPPTKARPAKNIIKAYPSKARSYSI